jgi:hypothetical protein
MNEAEIAVEIRGRLSAISDEEKALRRALRSLPKPRSSPDDPQDKPTTEERNDRDSERDQLHDDVPADSVVSGDRDDVDDDDQQRLRPLATGGVTREAVAPREDQGERREDQGEDRGAEAGEDRRERPAGDRGWFGGR